MISQLKYAANLLYTASSRARLHARKVVPTSRVQGSKRNIGCVLCGQYPEAYMAKNEVWELAGLDKNEMCCLSCLGQLLDRAVQITDLTNAPINAGYARFFMAGYNENSNEQRRTAD